MANCIFAKRTSGVQTPKGIVNAAKRREKGARYNLGVMDTDDCLVKLVKYRLITSDS